MLTLTIVPGPTLHNHDIEGSYPDVCHVKNSHLYCGRGLALTTPEDVIQLHPALQPELPHILAHLRRVGIDPTTHIVWDTQHAVGHQFPELAQVVFLYGQDAHDVRPNRRRLDATSLFNDKNRFLQWCQASHLAVPTTHFLAAGQRPTAPLAGTWYVKGALSASGMQVIRCESWKAVLDAADQMFGDYQIQAELTPDAWLNVQYLATPDGARHIATTEQILAGYEHAGNRFPSRFDPRGLTDPAADLASAAGLEGIFAFDVAAWDDNRFTIIECNPRPNGATYPTFIAGRLGVPEWTSVNLMTPLRSLADVHLGELEYDPSRATGVVIYNWGTILEGKLGVFLVGNSQDQSYLKAALKDLLF